MEIENVNIRRDGAAVVAIVRVVKSPVNIAGVVWRYKNDQSKDGNAGIFTTNISEVPLGLPGDIAGKFFLVEGGILHNRYSPPLAYQVVITLMQGSDKVFEKVPATGGSGQVGKQDVPFFHSFKLNAI